MKRIMVELTEELAAAVDEARGDIARNPWLEAQLWRLKPIRDAAASMGVAKPDRPLEGRGGRRETAT
jgi:hypothetical protein